jgi:AcrR family transcriptional regulator
MGTDFRSERTKEKIIKSFITLLGSKGYEKIAINEIASMANINRVTFYTHYKGKEDLLDDIIIRLQEDLSKKAIENQNNYKFSNEFQNYILAQVDVLVQGIDQYRHVIYELEAQDNVVIYYTLVNRTIEYTKKQLEEVNRITPLKYEPKYIAEFIVPGLFNVIMSYLDESNYDKVEFEKALSKFINDIITSNILM